MFFSGTKCFSLLLCCTLSLSVVAREFKKNVGAQPLHKPLTFIENKGQVTDEHSAARNDIQYKLAAPGMSLYVGSGGLHYQFKKVENITDANPSIRTYTMDVALVGANPNAKVEASDKQAYYESYFLPQSGNDGLVAHAWNKITYKEVYPNIDWVLYVKGEKVEYDFVVRPGGNVADIKLAYDGATQLSIGADGSLTATTPMGSITEHTPFAYETGTRKAVKSAFKLDNNVLSFETGAYKGSLTIDPFLQWSTFFGGTLEDVVTSVKQGPNGVTFACGYTASGGLNTSGPGYAGGSYDGFVTKYSATGVLQFAIYFGGVGSDKAMCLALDNTTFPNPNIYIAGVTSSNFGISTGGAYHTAYNGANDGFLAKINNTGTTRVWSTYYGGTGEDHVNAIAVDATGSVIIAGQTSSATLVSSGGAYQTARSGSNDAFLAKFNSLGANTWSTYYGGSSQEEAFAITTDGAANIYVTGQTNSITAVYSRGAYDTTLNGTNDAFLAKFTAGGRRVWGSYYGDTGQDQGKSIAYDVVNNKLAVIGNTTSQLGMSTPNGYQPNYGGGVQDAFLIYMDTSSTAPTWASYYGGESLDYGTAITFDPNGDIVLAGGTFSMFGMADLGTFAVNGYQSAKAGDYDAYFAKLNPLSQRLWGSYFGGSQYDFANAIDIANDQIVMGGFTTSPGLYRAGGIAQAGSADVSYAGGVYDGFVTKFNRDTLVTINQPYTDTLVCAGGTLYVDYTANTNFQPSNNFNVELSDITGNFPAIPNIIGTLNNDFSGTITCTIPSTLAPGTGYRIRITADNPIYVSPDDYLNITVVDTIPNATAAASTPTCVGNTLNLYCSTPYSVRNYIWQDPAGGFVSFLQNPTLGHLVTLADAGVYSVTTSHNGCPDKIATVNVVVNTQHPPMPLDSSSNPNCQGGSIYLFANPDTAVAGLTYHWSGPGGFTSTAQNPVITSISTANSGLYYVTDTMAGCPSVVNSIFVSVADTEHVGISITANPGDTVCQGTVVTFTATTVNGGTTPRYQWMSGPFTPIVGAMSSTFTSSTLVNGATIFCVLNSTITCPSPVSANSNVIKMNVISNPPVAHIFATGGPYVVPGSTVKFTSLVYNGGINPNYQWKVNGVNVPGAIADTFVLANIRRNDTVSLVVTSTMACAVPDFTVSNIIYIFPTTGVSNVGEALNMLQLYPNPNNGSFTLQGVFQDASAEPIVIEVVNMLGQVVSKTTATIQNNELNQSIFMNNVADGVYILRATQGMDSRTFRFSVQH